MTALSADQPRSGSFTAEWRCTGGKAHAWRRLVVPELEVVHSSAALVRQPGKIFLGTLHSRSLKPPVVIVAPADAVASYVRSSAAAARALYTAVGTQEGGVRLLLVHITEEVRNLGRRPARTRPVGPRPRRGVPLDGRPLRPFLTGQGGGRVGLYTGVCLGRRPDQPFRHLLIRQGAARASAPGSLSRASPRCGQRMTNMNEWVHVFLICDAGKANQAAMAAEPAVTRRSVACAALGGLSQPLAGEAVKLTSVGMSTHHTGRRPLGRRGLHDGRAMRQV
ncbi:hypothetical protein CryarDRAFT_1906 [Cryptosporangium arvum DSM 44712]|uniref:Uncharacterized protein n=1 Tax=Cryptosporangium arvum DSM 44712 TaxID=927661 RepID=A0A011AFM3_9ACTN|nr:hypothetical protein CryarDRAFT_1906 [Cryptosporangium arvum DSM 44712]